MGYSQVSRATQPPFRGPVLTAKSIDDCTQNTDKALAINKRLSHNIITHRVCPHSGLRQSMPIARTILCLATLSFVLRPTPASAGSPIDYDRDIRPFLSECGFKCHGAGVQKAGLRLDRAEPTTKKKAIVAGKPDESKLLSRVAAADDERMPPKTAGDRLAPERIANLRAGSSKGRHTLRTGRSSSLY